MGIQEDVFFEGGPHTGDLIVNTMIGATIIGLPLFIGSLVRKLWVKYRITNRRITVIGGWGGKDRSDVIYSEIAKVVTVPRGLGGWGDMVLTLKDGSRLELRSLPRFREIYDYITAKIDERARKASGPVGKSTAD
jgi:nitrogen fixation protein